VDFLQLFEVLLAVCTDDGNIVYANKTIFDYILIQNLAYLLYAIQEYNPFIAASTTIRIVYGIKHPFILCVICVYLVKSIKGTITGVCSLYNLFDIAPTEFVITNVIVFELLYLLHIIDNGRC
jgi:hypothetical protein